MGRAKIDNPLFAKTEGKSASLKVLDSKTLKAKEFKTRAAVLPKSKSLKDLNFKTSKLLNPKTNEDGQKKPSKFKTFKLPKFKTLESQLLVRLRPDQVDYLSKLESVIMKGRSSKNKKERITKNTIIRTAVDAIQSLNISAREVPNEETLLTRLKTAIQRNLKV